MSDYADYNLKNAKILHSHDICLFEVATCKNLIFILGMEYGGEYAGISFSNLIEDIKNSSEGKIEKPSISLMEFYIAKTLEIPCYVFRSEEVERAMREKTIDEKLRAEINFINHFSTPTQENVHGNWMYTYSSDEQLINMIDSIKFFE